MEAEAETELWVGLGFRRGCECPFVLLVIVTVQTRSDLLFTDAFATVIANDHRFHLPPPPCHARMMDRIPDRFKITRGTRSMVTMGSRR